MSVLTLPRPLTVPFATDPRWRTIETFLRDACDSTERRRVIEARAWLPCGYADQHGAKSLVGWAHGWKWRPCVGKPGPRRDGTAIPGCFWLEVRAAGAWRGLCGDYSVERCVAAVITLAVRIEAGAP